MATSVKGTAAFNSSSSNVVTSLSSRSALPRKDHSSLSSANSTRSNSSIESSSQRDPRVPATNSNGDYVTSILGYFTATYTYSSTTFTWHNAVITGPTTFVTIFSYTEIEADHYGPIKSSDVAPAWDRIPFMRQGYDYPEDPSSYSAAWSSFTSFGREPACTAAFSSFIATQPTITQTNTFATLSTLPNGRDTVGVVYNTIVAAPDEGDACCSRCNLIFQSLEMLYWPGPDPQTVCTTTSGSIAANRAARSTIDSGQGRGEPNIYATGSDGFILSVSNRPPRRYTSDY